MASIAWNGGTSGDWSDATDWSGRAVPGALDDVSIDAAGSYAVSITTAEAAHSLVLDDSGAALAVGSTLAITGATLALDAGTLTAASGGVIAGTLAITGAFTNTGSIIGTEAQRDGTTFITAPGAPPASLFNQYAATRDSGSPILAHPAA